MTNVAANQNSCDHWAYINTTANYTLHNILWNNGSNDRWILNVCPGIYSVSVADTQGCVLTDTVILGNITGCTDSNSINYYQYAINDDGSCISKVFGCTDFLAVNYNSNANMDDGSCCYISGCIDPTALNYDTAACFDDGSCIAILYGCLLYTSDAADE